MTRKDYKFGCNLDGEYGQKYHLSDVSAVSRVWCKDFGIMIEATVDSITGEDIVMIYLNKGRYRLGEITPVFKITANGVLPLADDFRTFLSTMKGIFHGNEK